MPGRREFLIESTAGLAGLLLEWPSLSAQISPSRIADSRIDVLLSEPLGTISPNIYGHFTENLGGVIYDGVWVGENSKIPNQFGIRSALVEQLRRIKAPVIRWPGGCFADSYDWRDGVGPREKRPRRTNFWNGSPQSPAIHKYDSNQFGTDDFVRFCRLTGAEPYLAANLRSLPAEEFDRWVEYCNSPEGSTTLADLRKAGGSPQPFNVRYWGVGNESWGCGGEFTAQEYAVEFRRYSAWLPTYGQKLQLIPSGPNDDDWNWTRAFLEEITRKRPAHLSGIHGLALHHYAWDLSRGIPQIGTTGNGDAIKFEPVDWYELLQQGNLMEGLIEGHWQVMGEFDKNHDIKLIVDEWGPSYRAGSEATPGDLLEQTPTLRDAVFGGMTLDTFNRHPEKVAMANCAQLINCLNSLYLAHEDRFVVTPVGRVFEMYTTHQGNQAVRTVISAPQVHYDRDGKPATFWGLQGSASLADKKLVLTVVNPHVSEPRLTEIAIRGAAGKSGTVTALTSPDIHAHNTFAQPNTLLPKTDSLIVKGSTLVHEFPPASVSALQIELV
jgi:alpha-N-arabinofuranosidase